MLEYKRLSNLIIGLLNKINKKVNRTELDEYAAKIRLLANNGAPTDFDFIITGIIKFAAENLQQIKQKKIAELKYENFDILKHYNENISKFTDEDTAYVWAAVEKIIGQAAKIKHQD